MLILYKTNYYLYGVKYDVSLKQYLLSPFWKYSNTIFGYTL